LEVQIKKLKPIAYTHPPLSSFPDTTSQPQRIFTRGSADCTGFLLIFEDVLREFPNNVASGRVFTHQVVSRSTIFAITVDPSAANFARSNPDDLGEVTSGIRVARIVEVIVGDFVVPGVNGSCDTVVSGRQVFTV